MGYLLVQPIISHSSMVSNLTYLEITLFIGYELELRYFEQYASSHRSFLITTTSSSGTARQAEALQTAAPLHCAPTDKLSHYLL